MGAEGICLPLWAVGALTAPLLTAIGVLWRRLVVTNEKMEKRFDQILRRIHEFEKDN